MTHLSGRGPATSGFKQTSRSRTPVLKRLLNGLAVAAACAAIAACSSAPQTAKNKFDPKKYGVKGSPRMVAEGQSVPKGGGRYVVGKPYKIAGKWYHPELDEDYEAVGLASWYGPTFHGRQTANGEVFDQDALTAAHTTMPLPSYARVTNLKNGRSVVVRVNDRGPFHDNREIDLSKRAAELLDFKGRGTAKVRVQYVGRARMDGRDSAFLMASYRGPGETGTGTMFAQAPQFDPVVHGPAPVPASRPYDGGDALVQVAFDPAVAFETRPALAYASEPAPMQAARGFAPQPVAAAFPTHIQGGEQTLGFLPASYARPEPQVPLGGLSSFAAEKRIDEAYQALETVSGGGDLAARASRAVILLPGAGTRG